jgi:hypothetical protein
MGQYFSRLSGPGAVLIKHTPGHIVPNLCFCVRWDLRVTKFILVRPGSIFHAWMGRCGIQKKHAQTCYAEHVFLHHVGSVGHVAHFRASGAQMSMSYFSCSGGSGAVSLKSDLEHITPKLCFCTL